MTRPVLPVWLLPCVALTALLSGYSILTRHQVESRNKAVTLAIEYESVEALASGTGRPIDESLRNLKAQGLGAIVLSEETIGELVSEGYGTVSGNEIVLRQDRVISSEKAMEALQARVERGLKNRFQGAKIVQGKESGERATRVEFASPSLIRQTSIGINPSIAQAVKTAGLQIICRMSNPVGVTSEYVKQTLTWANELGATTFLPQGDQVLGRRDSLDETVATLKSLNMLYASPEFTKIGGDANLIGAAPELVVRLHSAQSAELDKMPLAEVVERYSKAARERNMRILLVRPVSFASADPLHSFADLLRDINRAIRSEGGDMGPAKPFEVPTLPSFLLGLIALSLTPIAYFVGESLTGRRSLAITFAVLFLLLGLATLVGSGRSFTALGASLIFPIAAFLVLDARQGKHLLLEFFKVFAISLVGGLAVAGLLNGLPYFIRAQEFRGVKLAVFLPIIVAAWYFAARFIDIRAALKNPITWGAAFLALLVLVALVFMNSRTGNDNPAGVSDLELRFRSILDTILMVRPRTKSFLIGHPLMIVGIGLLLQHRSRADSKIGPWAALFLAGGMIGQTDVVNTLCHLHTPVALSLLRNVVGLVPGCIIGVVIWALVQRMVRKGEGEN